MFCFCVSAFLSFSQSIDSVALQRVDSLINLAGKLTTERKFTEAMQAAEAAEKLADAALGKAHTSYATSLFTQGRIAYLIGDYKKAEPLFNEARAVRGSVLGTTHPDYAACLANLGNLCWQMGRYQEAEPLYLEADSIQKMYFETDPLNYATSQNSLGLLYMQMGRYLQAEQHYLKSKAIREKISGKLNSDYGASLNHLGTLYWRMGRYEEAEALFLESLNIREKLWTKAHPSYAVSLINLANLYREMGRYEDAEKMLTEALDTLEKKLGNKHPTYAKGLHSLADFLATMGRYEAAEPLYLKAMEIWGALGLDNPEYVIILNNLALLYEKMGRYDQAEVYYLASKNLREKQQGQQHADYANSLFNLGQLYVQMGRYEEAERHYLEARKIRSSVLGKNHPDYAACLQKLGRLYAQLGRFEEAGQLYLEAKEIWGRVFGKEHPDYVALLNDEADLYKNMGRYEPARPLYIEANEKVMAQLSLSSRFLSNSELSAFVTLFTNSLNDYYSFSFLTRGAFPDFSAGCYDNALFYKGFLLNTSLRISQLASMDTAAVRLTNLLKPLHRQLANEYAKSIDKRRDVKDLEQSANTLEKELVRTVAGFGDAIRQVRWQDVQAKLKPDEAAIEFIHFQDNAPGAASVSQVRYAALVVRPGDKSPHWVSLFEAQQLAPLLPRSNDADGIDAFYKENGQAVYALIWQPLDSLLNGIRTLYCAPSGLLHRVNLGALPTRSSGGQGKTVFADQHHLVLLGSTRQLVYPKTKMPSLPKEAVLFGGIQYDSAAVEPTPVTPASPYETSRAGGYKPWRPLPGTVSEVKTTAALFQKKGFKTQLRTGTNATEEAFKQLGRPEPSPRMLHLATHGYFFPDPKASRSGNNPETEILVFKYSNDPMIRSGLILAGANATWTTGVAPATGEDGILTAYEISQQNLSNTNVAVLSACETGLGQIEDNEGVYGLQRAFKIAGVHYLIMSLWQISDQKTGELMILFYHNYLNLKLPVQEAFQAAQKAMRARYPASPYVWAAFILVE